ncbi:MAG: hypothetical protein MUF57_10960 [Gammaproteobacteria bacterium]|nr:hypothetical protein [Gammaproteobacteria bacterium]
MLEDHLQLACGRRVDLDDRGLVAADVRGDVQRLVVVLEEQRLEGVLEVELVVRIVWNGSPSVGRYRKLVLTPSLTVAARSRPSWSVCQASMLPGFSATRVSSPVTTSMR